KNRAWVFGAVLMILAVMALGWVLGISPKLDEARIAGEARSAVEAQNEQYELQLTRLTEQFRDIDGLKARLADLRKSVPDGADIPAFIGQLDSIGRQIGVTITTVTVNEAQVYAPAATAGTDLTVGTDADTQSAAAGVADADSAADAPADPALAAQTGGGALAAGTLDTTGAGAQLADGRVSADNFVAVPVSVDVEGNYSSVLNLVDALQKGRRLFTVTTFATAAVAGESEGAFPDGNFTATIGGYVYVLLESGAFEPRTG
ncbi:MAG TPA: hypothetical protein VGP03_14285, partial [Pseudonocardiaceae bacterium]|nr:hypothetical protein [Pseudonocardiaceae bacterium]